MQVISALICRHVNALFIIKICQCKFKLFHFLLILSSLAVEFAKVNKNAGDFFLKYGFLPKIKSQQQISIREGMSNKIISVQH